MSIWDKYPDLTTSELQVLVALTAQALRENAVDPSTGSESRLDLSPAAAARELAPALQAVDPAITRHRSRTSSKTRRSRPSSATGFSTK